MPDAGTELTVTASSILFGFLFAGFWWALDRELKFEEKNRHFKLGYLLLFVTMAALAVFGVLCPLRSLTAANPGLARPFGGVVVAVIGVFGYMLTEFGHYGIFQKPKYTTKLEWAFFGLTIGAMIVATAYWLR